MADWGGRKVLVTGAGGFIGSQLAERLAELGADVRAFLHYNARQSRGWLDDSPLAAGMEMRFGDLADSDSVRAAVQGCDTVFHLGALIAIPYSYQAPESYVRTNIIGTLNVLQAARAAGTRRVIHTSTSEVYGTARTVPIDENHPLQGQSPYSASKIGADKMAESFHLSFGLPVVTIRPFNTFGPRQSLRAVIPTIISQALRGDLVRLGSLHPTRDFNFVGDTIAGFVLAADADAAMGKAINLGSGREISMADLVTLIGQLLGKPLTVQQEAERLRPEGSEVDRLLASASLAHRLLGWTSTIGLEEGLNRTITWIRDHAARYDGSRFVV